MNLGATQTFNLQQSARSCIIWSLLYPSIQSLCPNPNRQSSCPSNTEFFLSSVSSICFPSAWRTLYPDFCVAHSLSVLVRCQLKNHLLQEVFCDYPISSSLTHTPTTPVILHNIDNYLKLSSGCISLLVNFALPALTSGLGILLNS